MTIELSQERRDELRKLIATDAQVDGVRKFALDAPIGEGPFIAILAVINRMEMAEDDIARQADALARAIAERDALQNAYDLQGDVRDDAVRKCRSAEAERDAAIARADALSVEVGALRAALSKFVYASMMADGHYRFSARQIHAARSALSPMDKAQ